SQKYFWQRHLILHALKMQVNHFWVETPTAQKALAKALNIDAKKITVVKNTYGEPFAQAEVNKMHPSDRLTILIPTAYYRHKQLEILPHVVNQLEAFKNDFQILLTLPHEQFQKIIPVACQKVIKNEGVQTP